MVFYGRIEDIWEHDYQTFRVILFKCSWVDNRNGVRVDDHGFTLVKLNKIGYKSEPFILGYQAKQMFYIEDPEDHEWSVVLASLNKQYTYADCDDLGDVCIELKSFSNGLLNVDTNSESDENEPPCVREN